MPRKTMIDLFCGTGGFAEGFLDADPSFELVYAVDLDPWATKTALSNHTGCLIERADIRARAPGDVKKVIGLDEVDIIIGGPPCQGFSSLRPRRATNNDDVRNDLYLCFGNYVEAFRPRLVVMENVVGLLTHDDGRTLQRVTKSFERIGYAVDWRVLNAASYGVPQKRERFVLLASRDNGPIEFPTPTHLFTGRAIGYRDKSRMLTAAHDAPLALTVTDAISDLPEISRGEEAKEYGPNPLNEYQRARRNGNKRLSLHKAAMHTDKLMEIIKHSGPNINSIPKGLITSGFSSCYSRLEPDQPSTTITVKFRSPASNKCIHPVQHRAITPREAARIQSFNDDYKFVGSLTRVAAQIGNAVPPLLGRALGESVIGLLA